VRTDDDVPFRATSESVGETVVVHVAGALDQVTAEELSHCLSGALHLVKPPEPLIVDLTEVDFLGACGIGVLLEHQDLCLSRGSALEVVACRPAVLRPLQVLELTSVLGVRPSLHPQRT
jgi:anti-sigma B factor antagonist